MPQIPLKDNFGLDLGIAIDPVSALSRYFQSVCGPVILHHDFKSVVDQPLSAYPFGTATINLGFGKAFTGEIPGAALTVGPGVQGSLTVVKQGSLFDPDPYGSPVEIAPAHAYVGFALAATVSASVATEAANPVFGFDSETVVAFSNDRLFEMTASSPSIGAAFSATIGGWIIPASISDLVAMPAGLVATLEGSGAITFTAQVDVAPLINPLASVSTAILAGAIGITAGASIPVTASYELRGEYQLRVRKLDAHRVEIGYLRKRGREFAVSASAGVGVTATSGGTSLVSSVLSALSPDPLIDLAGLHLHPEALGSLAAALKQSIDRELQLGVAAQIDTLASDTAVFLFEVDLTALDARGRKMVETALGSELSMLVESEHSLPPGIQWKSSVFTKARERGFTLGIDVFGFYNWASVHDLLVNSTIAADPESGRVVITDRVTASQIGLTTNLITSENRVALRSALGESFLLTVVYRCSNVLRQDALSGLYWFFDLDPAASEAQIQDHLNAIRALGISLPQGATLPMTSHTFGRTAFYLETGYSDAAVRSLFLQSDGSAKVTDDYESAGRNAMRAVLMRGGVNDVRLQALEDPRWAQVKAAFGNLETLAQLFPDVASPAVADVYGDWFVICNWSSAMAEAARTVAEAYPYFSGNPDPASAKFQSLRAELQKQMSSLERATKNRFAEPWGIVALDLVSGRTSAASAELYASGFTLVLKR